MTGSFLRVAEIAPRSGIPTYWLEPDPKKERAKRVADRKRQEAEERADDEEERSLSSSKEQPGAPTTPPKPD